MRAAQRSRAILEVLAASAAFGASVPAAKVLLNGISPLALAGGLYTAAGIVLSLWLAVSRLRSAPASSLSNREWIILATAILAGGVVAPLALLAGIERIPAYAAALLLNLEGVFTVSIAAFLAGERLGGRGWIGAGAVLAGGVVLTLGRGGDAEGSTMGSFAGMFLIALACLAWAVDNNLTRRVSLHDARQIVAAKGLAGGGFLLLLAGTRGELGGLDLKQLGAMSAVGAVSYGLSLVLYIRGLRDLGVALTGALFATSSGVGVLLAWLGLGENPGHLGLAAFALMTGGAIALTSDEHVHLHVHEALAHSHPHEHDEHHRHEHTPEELATQPHSHFHRHEPLAHTHPHTADAHHRHRHGGRERSA